MGAKKLKFDGIFVSSKGEEIPIRIVEELPAAFRVEIAQETGSFRLGRTFTAKKNRVSLVGGKTSPLGTAIASKPEVARAGAAADLSLIREMPRGEKGVNWDAVTKDISGVLNRHGLDNLTSSPDFILADYIVDNVKVTREFLISRKKWRGDENSAVCKEDFGGVI